MSGVVAELEQRFMPRFAEVAGQLERDFPAVRTTAWSAPIGTLTDYQGHSLGVDCLFPGAPTDQSDNVALEISVWHLTTIPELYTAGVGWGAPGGGSEIELIPSPIPYTASTLDTLELQIVELIAALRRAVARGCPPSSQSTMSDSELTTPKGFP